MFHIFAILMFKGFSCTTDSGMVASSSSLEDCSEQTCLADYETCYEGVVCNNEDTSGCVEEEGDYLCHYDCSDSENCASGEECAYVGNDTWLCL